MKMLLQVICFFLFVAPVFSQTYEIHYGYDNAGNRIIRQKVQVVKIKKQERLIVDSLPVCKVYPNPASEYINIEIENYFEEFALLEVVNSSGQVVLTDQVRNSYLQVSVSEFRPGVYFIRLELKDAEGESYLEEYKLLIN